MATPEDVRQPTPRPAFRPEERKALLGTPGIGPVIVMRLEQAGLGSLDRLREVGTARAAGIVCTLQGSPAWMNRHRALARALEAASVPRRGAQGEPGR
jgi:hypothetical protein